MGNEEYYGVLWFLRLLFLFAIDLVPKPGTGLLSCSRSAVETLFILQSHLQALRDLKKTEL